MGGNQSSKLSPSEPFDEREWEKESRSNGKHILTNIHDPSQTLEEYFISIDNEEEFKEVQEMYTLRKNDPEIVSSHHIKVNKDQQLCSKSYNGSLYLERIPLTLSDVTDIPFPDVLHVHNQSLNGFQRLARRYGHFPINEDCIAVNNQNHVKVWHSHEYDRAFPKNRLNSEQQMVSNIVDIIEHNTDHRTLPFQEPSIANFIYKQANNVGFSQAKRRLQQYANLFNRGVIPNHLNCAEKVGGAEKIKQTWAHRNARPSELQSSNSPPQPLYHEAPPVLYQNNEPNRYMHNSRSFDKSENRLTKSQVHISSEPPVQNLRKSRDDFKLQAPPITVNNSIEGPNFISQNPVFKKQSQKEDRKYFSQTQKLNNPDIRSSQQLTKVQGPKPLLMSQPQPKIQANRVVTQKVQNRPSMNVKIQNQQVENKKEHQRISSANLPIQPPPQIQVQKSSQIEKKAQQPNVQIQSKAEKVRNSNPQINEVKKPTVNIVQQQKPSQPVVQQQKPSQPVVQQQKPSQPVVQQQKPSQPVVQQQRPSQPVVQQQKPPQQIIQQQKPPQQAVQHQQNIQKPVSIQQPVIQQTKIPQPLQPQKQQTLIQPQQIKIQGQNMQPQNMTIQPQMIRNQAQHKIQGMNQVQVRMEATNRVQNQNYPSPHNIAQNVPISVEQRELENDKKERPTEALEEDGKLDRKVQNRKSILDQNGSSPVVSHSDSPQRHMVQIQPRQVQEHESINSVGFSNVPNQTNSTTRNFYQNIQLKPQNEEKINNKYQTYTSGYTSGYTGTNFTKNKYDGNVEGTGNIYSFGNNNEQGTSTALLDQLKTNNTKYNPLDFVSESYKYTSSEGNENGYSYKLSSPDSYKTESYNYSSNYSPSYEYKKDFNADYETKNNLNENGYEFKTRENKFENNVQQKIQQTEYKTYEQQNHGEEYQTYQHEHQTYQPEHQTYQPEHQTYQHENQTYQPEHQTYQQEHQTYQHEHQTYQPEHQTYQQERTEVVEEKQQLSAPITQLENLEMKYSVVEEGYNVAWDPEILADLQANVHQK